MSEHGPRAFSIADKVVSLGEDGLRGLDLAVSAWPAEFRAIIWETVADVAARRGVAARDAVSSPPGSGK